ncbi:MAG TPA: response regulator [Leptospiraceae bacterium]|nr:response regulator [Leptospirales bacterium]HMU84361.1 response regulator [Leptospiraceae bacterium]HMX56069.1 response regulator [Leptospiraceae bacterium]HMY45862.1 response regulator [Leptospiraceae bacterium]HMZ35241.1 response regulator [Leptospiraceae bacterium]
MKILTVDDSSTVRFVMKSAIESLGHTCLMATNGQEALAIVSAEPIDVVLLDWNMPLMDGREVLREIRKKPICKNTKVLMCTSEATRGDVEQILRLGVEGYILKPISPDKLKAELAKIGVGPA